MTQSSSTPKNGVGIASLVIAIVGLATSFTVAGGLVLGTGAVALGFAGRGRISRGEAENGGMAVTGIAVGSVAIAAGLLFIIVWVVFWASISNSDSGDDYLDCLQRAEEDAAGQQQCAEEFTFTPATPVP